VITPGATAAAMAGPGLGPVKSFTRVDLKFYPGWICSLPGLELVVFSKKSFLRVRYDGIFFTRVGLSPGWFFSRSTSNRNIILIEIVLIMKFAEISTSPKNIDV